MEVAFTRGSLNRYAVATCGLLQAYYYHSFSLAAVRPAELYFLKTW